jgi:hypothetical protein
MIDPAQTCLWIPPELRAFKLELFNRIGRHIEAKGGQIVRHDPELLRALNDDVIPVVGCTPLLTTLIAEWRARKRTFVYWDRGYARRVFATWLARGENGGFYRWHINSYQMTVTRDVPADRWETLKTEVKPWRSAGNHIVIAAPSRTYARFHRCEGWIADTIDALARVTNRQLIIRDKESRRPLQADLEGAHALVSHGSIAAVEAVICGTPVFVHPDSAAALVGLTDLKQIERPVMPDRMRWLGSLAYSQFDEAELVDGTLWNLLR